MADDDAPAIGGTGSPRGAGDPPRNPVVDLGRSHPRTPGMAYLSLGLLAAGFIGFVAGAGVRFVVPQAEGTASLLQGASVLLLGLAISVGWGVDHIYWLRPRAGDPRVSDLRNWQFLKVLAVLLNLLMLLALIILVGTLLIRLEVFQLQFSEQSAARISTFLGAGLVAATVLAYLQAYRVDLELDRSMAVAVAHVFTVMLAFGGAAYAMLLHPLGSAAPTAASDAPLVFLLAATLLSLDLFMTRSLPNAYSMLAGERGSYRGASYFSQSKAVLLPIAIALGLLFVAFLVLVAIEAGAERAIDTTDADPLVIVIVVAVLAAVVASLFIARRLARQEDKPELYRRPRTVEEVRGRTLLTASVTLGLLGAVFAGVALTGVSGIARGLWVDILAVAILLALGPYGFYVGAESRRIRNLEERFPDFLRDIAASHQGGLTLRSAVTVASRGEYGTLSPYVRRMSDQMTWNVPFGESLKWLADQVNTPLVKRAVYLILEADRSGGSTSDVLAAAARDAREIKKMEVDRRIAMSLYTIVMYITFGVFLLVAAVLYNQFVPQLLAATQATSQSTLESPVGGDFGDVTLADYRAFYYIAAMVQGLGGGLVAGLMSTGKASLGLRHAFAMVGISFVVFTFLLS